MTSKANKQEKFATFLMTGDTIIKTNSVLKNEAASHFEDSDESKDSARPAVPNQVLQSSPTQIGVITQPNNSCNYGLIKTPEASEYGAKLYPGVVPYTPRRTIELEIPPDDISVEDEQFKEVVENEDDFPPPPAHFFHQSTSSDGFCTFTSIQNGDQCKQENALYSNSNITLTTSSTSSVSESNKSPKLPTKITTYSSEKELLKDNSKDMLKRSMECDDLKSPEKAIQDQLGSQTRVYRSHENYLQMLCPIDYSPMVLEEPGAVSVDALNYERIESSLNNVEAFLNSNDLCDIIDFSKRNSNFQPNINLHQFIQSQPEINSHPPNPQADNASHLNSQPPIPLAHNGQQINTTNNNIENQETLIEAHTIAFKTSQPRNNITIINEQPREAPTSNHSTQLTHNITQLKPSHSPNNSILIITTPPINSSVHPPTDTTTPSTTNPPNDHPDLLTTTTLSCLKLHETSSHPTIDISCAHRLANRLYNLDGFNRSDVSRHLSKSDPFSLLVGREYLRYFDFTNLDLDTALRSFLVTLVLEGETQEKERVLSHFSYRFLHCKASPELSEDAYHTLVCAILLLNTDHHAQKVQQKMSLNEFIDNLKGLNDNGTNYPTPLLTTLYHSIASDPLPTPLRDLSNLEPPRVSSLQLFNHLTNPFLMVPDAQRAQEYKKGYMMKKNCVSAGGQRTSLGKRAWQMYFVVLRDMVLYLYKDAQEAAKADKQGFEKSLDHRHKYLRVHHSLARPALDYQKKQFVFRLNTYDQAEYLFQTSDSAQSQSWIDKLNLVSASLSGPPLPSGVGSQKKKFQRPLMPSSYTKFNLREQYENTLKVLEEMEDSLKLHRLEAPKGGKLVVLHEFKEKENYLSYEIERFTVYSRVLKNKMNGVIN